MHTREWIAERILKEGKSRRRLIVRLEKPRMISAQEWSCYFEIVRGRTSKGMDVLGEDSFQSLMLALKAIRYELDRLEKTLTWDAGEAGDTGFPLFVPSFFGRDFARHLESIIESETERFGAEVKRRKL